MSGQEERAAGVVTVPEGYIVVRGRIVDEQETEAIGRAWSDAMASGKVPVFPDGVEFVAFSEAAALRMKARRYLAKVERLGHPHADVDPVGALGQVAADLAQAVAMHDVVICQKQLVERIRAAVDGVFDRYSPAPFAEDYRRHVLDALDGVVKP